MNNYIITIARGFGSGGKTIAHKLAEALSIECYENRILTLASQLGGINENILAENDERLPNGPWVQRLRQLPHSLNLMPIEKTFESDMRIFDLQKQIILKLANTENCVIVGKCSDYILQGKPNVINIYIDAPREHCIKRVIQKDPTISEKKADHLIEKTDQYRSDYYRYYTNGKNWRNLENYDLILNSSRMTDEECIEMIFQYLKLRGFLNEGAVNENI